jgi:hypothetical protein
MFKNLEIRDIAKSSCAASLFYYATETRNSYMTVFRGSPYSRGKKFKMVHYPKATKKMPCFID